MPESPISATKRTGGKYKCNTCDKVFPSPAQLKRHKIVHSDERPFKCDFCEKSFRRKYDCSFHMKMVHIKKNRFDLPVVEIKFELDDDFTVDKVESLTDDVKKEIIEDDNEFHIMNLP